MSIVSLVEVKAGPGLDVFDLSYNNRSFAYLHCVDL